MLKPLWIGYLNTQFGIDHNIEFTNFVFGYKYFKSCGDIVILNYPGMKTQEMEYCDGNTDAQIVQASTLVNFTSEMPNNENTQFLSQNLASNEHGESGYMGLMYKGMIKQFIDRRFEISLFYVAVRA